MRQDLAPGGRNPFAALSPEEILAVGGERVTSEHSRRAYRAGLAALAAHVRAPRRRRGDRGAPRGRQRRRARGRRTLPIVAARAGLAPATINLRLVAIRSAVRLARLAGAVEWELHAPAVPAAPRRETRGPASADVRRLGEAAGRQDTAEKATRDVALIRLLFDLGLRRAEVVAIDLADVARCGSSFRRTGVLPARMTSLGLRTALTGLWGRTWPMTR